MHKLQVCTTKLLTDKKITDKNWSPFKKYNTKYSVHNIKRKKSMSRRLPEKHLSGNHCVSVSSHISALFDSICAFPAVQ